MQLTNIKDMTGKNVHILKKIISNLIQKQSLCTMYICNYCYFTIVTTCTTTSTNISIKSNNNNINKKLEDKKIKYIVYKDIK